MADRVVFEGRLFFVLFYTRCLMIRCETISYDAMTERKARPIKRADGAIESRDRCVRHFLTRRESQGANNRD